jgi:hypothetical protein
VAQTGGADLPTIELPITKGIAGSVERTSQPLFNPESDRRTGYRTRTILCLPILDREGEPFGGGAAAQYCAVTNIGYNPPPDRTVRGRVRGGVAAHPSR